MIQDPPNGQYSEIAVRAEKHGINCKENEKIIKEQKPSDVSVPFDIQYSFRYSFNAHILRPPN